MEMTIKQLANELHVGKTTINRVIAQLDLQDKLHKIGNRYVLSETQIEQIRLKISHQSNHENTPNEPKLNQSNQMHQSNQDLQLSILNEQLKIKDNQIQMLQKQLETKDYQITEKDKQIKLLQEQISQLTSSMNNLATALSAAQALHAGTIQKQLAEHSVMEEPEQPKKQGFLSRFFGKKEN